MSDLTDRLNAIKALALRDLESTSDEQIRAEFIEDKQDPAEVAHKVAASLARVVERTASNQQAMAVMDAQRDEIDRLTAERDALRERVAVLDRDAARYRYLRDVAWHTGSLIFYEERYGPEDWNAHIDAARAALKGASHE